MISPFALTIIKTFEKFEPKVYLDAVGVPTIGYGHLIKPGEDFGRLTEAEATQLLKQDAFEAERAVDRIMSSYVLQERCRREALVSWTFNLGAGSLQDSTLRRVANGGAPDRAVAAQIVRWVHAGGRRLSGLVRRRHCEAIWYMGAPDEIVLAVARRSWA